jgi:hypothetical protein
MWLRIGNNGGLFEHDAEYSVPIKSGYFITT